MSNALDALSATPINVDDDVLDDLRSRLRATNWPADEGNEHGYYGVPRALLQESVQYGADEYDWRAVRHSHRLCAQARPAHRRTCLGFSGRAHRFVSRQRPRFRVQPHEHHRPPSRQPFHFVGNP